jgi:lysophospholipase L1-like esterase
MTAFTAALRALIASTLATGQAPGSITPQRVLADEQAEADLFDALSAQIGAVPVPLVRRAACTRVGLLGGVDATNVTDGTVAGATYRNWHQIGPVAVSDLVVKFANWRWTPSAPGEVVGANSITVKASIEQNGLTSWPLYFKGQRTAVIDPGGTLESDPISVQLPANSTVWVRVYVTNNSNVSGTWPLGRIAMTGGFESNNYIAATGDLVDGVGQIAGSSLVGNSSYQFGPVSVTGLPAKNGPVVGILGDSIACGSGDTGTTVTGYYGYIERGLGTTVPWVSLTRAGYRGAWVTAQPSRALTLHATSITSVIIEMGVNDIFAGIAALATLQATQIAIWNFYGNRGVRAFQTTISPDTTSTDSFATTANQTSVNSGQNTVRVNFNNWLRGGAPIVAGAAVALGTVGALLTGQAGHPLAGYFEMADVCESGRDSGVWAVNGSAFFATLDGLHPSPAFHTLLAAVVSNAVATGIIT